MPWGEAGADLHLAPSPLFPTDLLLQHLRVTGRAVRRAHLYHGELQEMLVLPIGRAGEMLGAIALSPPHRIWAVFTVFSLFSSHRLWTLGLSGQTL